MKRARYSENAELVQFEAMSALNMLAAGLAHEINTPVGSIHSNNDIFLRSIRKIRSLLDGCTTDNARQIREVNRLLEILEDTCRVNDVATERIMHVVRNLKDFARLDETERKRVNLHDGIESTLALVKHQFKNRIRVVKEYGNLPEVECYPNALNQVFMNLLVNAAGAITERGTVTIRTKSVDDGVSVAISDTGSGISPEDITKIFEPGFTTKGVGVGSGLGLSICYTIVTAHRGSIEVESALGKGSTFTITIPSNSWKGIDHGRPSSSNNSASR